MVAAFSAPILSVAADAVRDLEGRDASFGLWTVFTKCKQSLPNGARLENITWRLWHCELKGPEMSSQIAKEGYPAETETLASPEVQLPPTPCASYCIYPTQTPPAVTPEDPVLSSSEGYEPPYSLSYPPGCMSQSATRATSTSRRQRASRAVGRIICDFLPTNQDPAMDQPSSMDHPTDVPSWSPEGAAPIYQSNPKTALLPSCAMRPSAIILPEARLVASCLPTPDTPYLGLADWEPSVARTATQSPSQYLNAGQVVDSTPGLLSEPPRLVVVKPTPSPTPQPTPPTTPLMTAPATAVQGSQSLWLTPLPLTRDPVSQPIYDEPTAVSIPDHADIWTHDIGHDHTDGLSVSSIASRSSECSHTTTTSMAWASTTPASSIGYLHDEREKPSDLIGTTMGYRPFVGNLPWPTSQELGSLSTIQSISTDRGRRAAVSSCDIGDASSGIAAQEGDEQDIIEKGKPSSGSRDSSASKKRAKRNSAPVSLALMPCPHVDQFPHHSLAAPISSGNPTTSGSTSDRPTISNSAMNSDNRSSGQSCSRESSVAGSRSRSRGHSGGTPFADLSGIGTLGGYTIAAAYPPPNMTVRKQVAVGVGKSKVKVAFGRGLGGKSKVVRRNSAGSAADVGAKQKDRVGNPGGGGNLEKAKSEEHQQSRLEDILEKPTIDRRIGQPQEPPQVTLIHEEKVPQDAISTAAAKQATAHAVLPKRYAELLTIGQSIQSIKRHPRFNIGSNSDDGSGMTSKSVGSGSSQSIGHSLGQRSGKMIEDSKPRVGNEKKLEALLLEEQERRLRGDAEVEVQQLELQQRRHHNTHFEPLPAALPLHKPMKQEIRHSKATHHTHNINLPVLEHVQSSGQVTEKAKGRPTAVDHHLVTSPSSKTKSKSTPNLGSLDAVLAAKVRDSLGEPLLPKGRPVVVDTESDFETETDDGTWSDEERVDETEARKQEQIEQELALQQERERKEAELQEQELLLQQMYLQQQQNLPRPQLRGGRPAGVQRTHSSHYPAPNHARTNKGPAPRNRHQKELALHHAKLEQAAKEAQRQRDMIQKLPRESFQDLAKARANSVGLLSQLLKSNPEVPPSNHSHKRGYSSGAIQPLPPTPTVHPTTSDPGPAANSGTVEPNGDSQQSTPAPQTGGTRVLPPRRHASTDEGRRRMPSWSKIISPIRCPPLQLTKSSAAFPVSSGVQAGSVIANGGPSATVISSRILVNNLAMTGSGGYRPKGPPKGQEMEEDSDSEPETEKIQISKSIAERKLKALAQKRGITQHQAVVAQPQPLPGSSKVVPPGDEDVPDWARVSQPGRQPERQRRPVNGLQITPLVRPPPSAPIPLGLPYNLPLPAPPTTPRTTRRQMLSTELSESLRRNLLWERQVSKSNLAAAMRRSSSGVANPHDGLGRLQPFTSIAPVVQLHAKGTIPLDQQEDPAKRAAAPLTEIEREEMRRHAIARNRSWANDFHYAGW